MVSGLKVKHCADNARSVSSSLTLPIKLGVIVQLGELQPCTLKKRVQIPLTPLV